MARFIEPHEELTDLESVVDLIDELSWGEDCDDLVGLEIEDFLLHGGDGMFDRVPMELSGAGCR